MKARCEHGAGHMNTMPLNLVVPGDPETRTGGYIYDRRVAAELETLGWDVAVTGLEGRFPDIDETARSSMSDCLSGLDDGAMVIMDGLALGAAPEVIGRHSERLDLISLVHLPLCDEGGLDQDARRTYETAETAALEGVRRIVVTSDFTARRLCQLGVAADNIRVAEPGTDAAPLARGSGGPGAHMLCAATVTPRKRHDVLLRALAGIKHLDWTLTCVGDFDQGGTWFGEIFNLVKEAGIAERVTFAGVKSGAALAAEFDAADLFVLASQYESFGMVFTEALACGLPIVATTGGAIPDTVPAGAGVLVPPGDVAAFGAALSSLLCNPEQVATLKSGAARAREGLPSWGVTGRVFDGHLREVLDP